MNFIVQALCPLWTDCIKINMCNLSSGESLEQAGTLPELLLSRATIHCMNECGEECLCYNSPSVNWARGTWLTALATLPCLWVCVFLCICLSAALMGVCELSPPYSSWFISFQVMASSLLVDNDNINRAQNVTVTVKHYIGRSYIMWCCYP